MQTMPGLDFARKIPKVEIHAHLSGSISEATINKLIERKRLREPDWERDDEWRTCLQKNDRKTLEDCFRIFKLIHTLSDSEEAAYIITKDVIEEFAADNVKYLELRTTPRSVPATGMTKRSYVRSVLKAIAEQEQAHLDITVRLLLAIDRRTTLDDALDTLSLAKEMRTESGGVVLGLDLSGDPTKGDARTFLPIFRDAKKEGFRISLHLAEVAGKNDETQAMLSLPPDRVGHGTFLQQELGGTTQLVESMETHRIPLEVCLTSNLVSQTVTKSGNHHFAHWYTANHPVSICTDDKGVFSTSLSEEYQLAASTFQLSPTQLWDLSYGSIDHIFASDDVKSALRRQWSETKWNLFKEFGLSQE